MLLLLLLKFVSLGVSFIPLVLAVRLLHLSHRVLCFLNLNLVLFQLLLRDRRFEIVVDKLRILLPLAEHILLLPILDISLVPVVLDFLNHGVIRV